MSSDELSDRTSLEKPPSEMMGGFFETRGDSVYELFPGMNVLQYDRNVRDEYEELESIQPFIAGYSSLFRSARTSAEQGIIKYNESEGMGGIEISNTPLEESDALANFLIASGDVNLNSFDFFSDLNDISALYDEFIETALNDKNLHAAAKKIAKSPEVIDIREYLEDYSIEEARKQAAEIKEQKGKIIPFIESEKQKSGLVDLVKVLDRNKRVFQVLDNRDASMQGVKLEPETFKKQVELTQGLQDFFMKMESTYRFGGTKEKHRRNFVAFMAQFFDAMENDYHLSGEYDSFLRSQERGILSSVQSMLYFQDRGFEIVQVDQLQDTDYKIDFIAKKDGVEYVVQAKSVNRSRLTNSQDGTIVYADNTHVTGLVNDDGGEPIYVTRAPQNPKDKLKEFINIHNPSVSKKDGWIWIEVDPYTGIEDNVLRNTGRVRKAA